MVLQICFFQKGDTPDTPHSRPQLSKPTNDPSSHSLFDISEFFLIHIPIRELNNKIEPFEIFDACLVLTAAL